MQTNPNAIILACFIMLSLLLSGCKKQSEECLSFTTAHVTKVTGPNTVSVNQVTDFVVQYYLANGCGIYESQQSTSNGNTITISLIAMYKGCICTAVLLSGEANYRFIPTATGTYYLKFVQPDNTYFTYTVIVN